MAAHDSISENALTQALRQRVLGQSSVEKRPIVVGSSAEADEADKTAAKYANYRALVERVDDVFGDELKASAWLSAPNSQLAGRTPLHHAREADYDPESLEPLLIRLEHGVYV